MTLLSPSVLKDVLCFSAPLGWGVEETRRGRAVPKLAERQ